MFHSKCIVKHIKASVVLFGERYCPLCRAQLLRYEPSDSDTVSVVHPPFVMKSYGIKFCEARGVLMLIINPR